MMPAIDAADNEAAAADDDDDDAPADDAAAAVAAARAAVTVEPYAAPYSDTRMVGSVAATSLVSTTWFGMNAEYVHGINILPVTPATELLLRPDFVAREYVIGCHRVS